MTIVYYTLHISGHISLLLHTLSRLQLKCDGTRWRTVGEVKGKLSNAVCSQYPSHYLRTWCSHHHYRWCAHLGCQQSTELKPPPNKMDWSVSPKDKILFLRVCHQISIGLYITHSCPGKGGVYIEVETKLSLNTTLIQHGSDRTATVITFSTIWERPASRPGHLSSGKSHLFTYLLTT